MTLKRFCTLINVFAVDPEKYLELFDELKQATESIISKMPGYISANLHISDASLTDFRDMQQNEEA